MWESPIEIIKTDIQTHHEEMVMEAVLSCGINVNKEELIKALQYDRQQYEKGYEDAKAERKKGKWIPNTIIIGGRAHVSGMKCSVCGEDALNAEGDEFLTDYCPNCGARMDND